MWPDRRYFAWMSLKSKENGLLSLSTHNAHICEQALFWRAFPELLETGFEHHRPGKNTTDCQTVTCHFSATKKHKISAGEAVSQSPSSNVFIYFGYNRYLLHSRNDWHLQVGQDWKDFICFKCWLCMLAKIRFFFFPLSAGFPFQLWSLMQNRWNNVKILWMVWGSLIICLTGGVLKNANTTLIMIPQPLESLTLSH